MDVTVSKFGDMGTRVVLAGKLDIAGAERITAPLAAAADARNNVVVDMGAVDFITSVGIRELVMAAKTVARASRILVLLDPNPVVRHILVTAGLTDLLPIVRSEDEARIVLSAKA
jgi:anti-sigma B factor antagonist